MSFSSRRTVRIHRGRGRFILMLATTGAAMISLLASDPGSAQTRPARAVPGDDYILAFNPFYDGEYLTALRAFRSAAKSGVRSTEGVWIDAICYSTMMGECFYHLGDFKSAVAQYEVALELHLAHRGWLKRIQLPPRIQGPTPTQPLPWGPSGRPTAPARLPDTYLSLQGTNTEQVVRQGGIFAPPELYPVRVNEILRCLALAMRRRAELLGPLSTESPLSGQLVREFSAARVPAGHWMGALLSVCKGLAQLNDGDSKAALQTLQRSLVIAGRLDHPLTDTALLEIGKIAVEADNLALAKQSFYEATFPAAFYRHGDVLQEAFQWAAAAHRISNPQQPYPPLAPAASWARVKGFRRVHVSLLLDSIDQLSLSGQDRLATGLLSQARRGMGRSDLIRSDVGARLQYLQSRLAQRQGKSAAALAALKGAVALQRNHSARLYQIARVDQLYVSRNLSPRVTSTFLRDAFQEPETKHWQWRPLDTLTGQMTPLPQPIGHLLEIGLARNDVPLMTWANDQQRRDKFFALLPFGGRLLALRWIAAAPESRLPKEIRGARKELFNRYAALDQAEKQTVALRAPLHELAAKQDPDARRQYQVAAQQLANISNTQELLLMQSVFEPFAAPRLFPPMAEIDKVQSGLRTGQTVLMFINTGNEARAVLLTSGAAYRQIKLPPPGGQRQTMQQLMSQIGNFQANQVLSADLLQDEQWRTTAASLAKPLAELLSPEVLRQTEELTIVPDGNLWYLPFELLPLSDGKVDRLLIDHCAVRYAPTLGLAIDDTGPRTVIGTTAIAAGRIFSRQGDAFLKQTARDIAALRPNSFFLRRPLAASSNVLAAGWDALIVLDDIEDLRDGPGAWSIVQVDKGKPGSRVHEWLALPFPAPDQIVEAGYTTAAESGLKGRTSGDELMTDACFLLANGTRNVLLSRWRTGGKTGLDMIKEYVQETPNERPAAAWQRAVLLARSAPLDPSTELRVKDVTERDVPQADHPFFWAGFLLLDRGFSEQP